MSCQNHVMQPHHAKPMQKPCQKPCKIVRNKNARGAYGRGVYAGQVARPDGGFYAGQVARQECGALGIEASNAGQECDAGKHKWHLCFRSASELETGTTHFLGAARVEFHVEFPQSWGDNRIENTWLAWLRCQQARQAPSRRTLTVPRVLAIRAICAIWVSQGEPLNLHSPPRPCYMCYMCYMALTRQATANIRAICAIWVLHAKPLNPHSPPAPCYMYYMCYILILYARKSVLYVLYRAI